MMENTRHAPHLSDYHNLPVPFFILDDTLAVVFANQRFRDLLKTKEKKRFLMYFSDHHDRQDFLQRIERQSAFQQDYSFIHDGGEIITGRLFMQRKTYPNRSSNEYFGVIQDITEDERKLRSINDLPVGYYEVDGCSDENDREYISNCNNRFAEIFGYTSSDKVIGQPVENFYPNKKHFLAFQKYFDSEIKADPEKVVKKQEELIKKDGTLINTSVEARGIFSTAGDLLGRYGIIRDISKEYIFREKLSVLANDIGHILHNYTSTLIGQISTIKQTIQLLGEQPFAIKKTPNARDVIEELEEPLQLLKKSIQRLMDQIGDELNDRDIPKTSYQQLSDEYHRLMHCETIVDAVEFQPRFINEICRNIIPLIDNLSQENVPKETIKDIQRNIFEVQRIISVAGLISAHTEILDMDHQLSSFREYVTADVRPSPEKTTFELWEQVLNAMKNLFPYAENKGVFYREENHIGDLQVFGSQRDIIRALTNLLHNAIKYSWEKRGGDTYVLVKAYEEGNFVIVLFENYGVPIPKDEIEKGLIFKVGYRGRLSSDRGRTGTGFGLKDAQTIARAHGGDVRVESVPATQQNDPLDYSKPFITTVYFQIKKSEETQ